MGKIKGILPEYRSNTALIESNSPQGALYCLTWNTPNSAVWVTTNTIVCWLWLFHPDKTRRFTLQKATWLHKAELGGKLSPSYRDRVPLRWELHELPQWWLFCSRKHHPAFECLLMLWMFHWAHLQHHSRRVCTVFFKASPKHWGQLGTRACYPVFFKQNTGE